MECKIRDARIEALTEMKVNLKGLLQEARDREKIAIDTLLVHQGKAPVSTHQLSLDEANAMMNPFSEVAGGKKKQIMPGVFEDVLGRESG